MFKEFQGHCRQLYNWVFQGVSGALQGFSRCVPGCLKGTQGHSKDFLRGFRRSQCRFKVCSMNVSGVSGVFGSVTGSSKGFQGHSRKFRRVPRVFQEVLRNVLDVPKEFQFRSSKYQEYSREFQGVLVALHGCSRDILLGPSVVHR